MLLPAAQHPFGDIEFGGGIGTRDRRTGYFAQNGVNETGGGKLARALDELDAIADDGVSGDAIEIAELEDSHAQGDAHGVVELLLGLAGKMADQKIDFALAAQASEDDGFGEGGIAFGERAGFRAQQIGGIAAFANLLQNLKGYFPGGRDGGHASVTSITIIQRWNEGRLLEGVAISGPADLTG